MFSKLFIILSLITFLLEVSQAKLENGIINFLEISMLNEATEDQKILFFKNSFDHADAYKNGFVTTNELAQGQWKLLEFGWASTTYIAVPVGRKVLTNPVFPKNIGWANSVFCERIFPVGFRGVLRI